MLLQFPWSFSATSTTASGCPTWSAPSPGYPLVLEVRHASWNVPAFYEQPRRAGLGFVNIDQPLFQQLDQAERAAPPPSVGYVRVHGRNYRDWFREKAGRDARYDYLYSRRGS